MVKRRLDVPSDEAGIHHLSNDPECAAGGARFQPARDFYFRATPKAVETLRFAGIDGVHLADNHALDYGPDALLEALRRLDEAAALLATLAARSAAFGTRFETTSDGRIAVR